MSDKTREALVGMLARYVAEGTGVTGYHLSGNIAEWGEFSEGEAARAALAQQPATAFPADVRALLEELAQYAPPEGVIVAPTAAMAMGRKAKRILSASPAAPAPKRIAGYRVDEKLFTTWGEAQRFVRTGRTRNGTIEPLYAAPPAAEYARETARRRNEDN